MVKCGGYLWQRHGDDCGGQDMKKEILSTEQLRVVVDIAETWLDERGRTNGPLFIRVLKDSIG